MKVLISLFKFLICLPCYWNVDHNVYTGRLYIVIRCINKSMGDSDRTFYHIHMKDL